MLPTALMVDLKIEQSDDRFTIHRDEEKALTWSGRCDDRFIGLGGPNGPARYGVQVLGNDPADIGGDFLSVAHRGFANSYSVKLR